MNEQPRRRRLWPIFVAVAAVVAVIYGVLWSSGNRRPPRTIDDPTFESRAARMCAERLPDLRAGRRDRGAPPDRSGRPEAPRVDRAARGLRTLAADLRALPVEADDKAAVDRWLDDWDRYVRVGDRYAAALAAGAEADEYDAIAREGDGPVRRIARFARANHIDPCRL